MADETMTTVKDWHNVVFTAEVLQQATDILERQAPAQNTHSIGIIKKCQSLSMARLGPTTLLKNFADYRRSLEGAACKVSLRHHTYELYVLWQVIFGEHNAVRVEVTAPKRSEIEAVFAVSSMPDHLSKLKCR